jgi:hypothetical protein
LFGFGTAFDSAGELCCKERVHLFEDRCAGLGSRWRRAASAAGNAVREPGGELLHLPRRLADAGVAGQIARMPASSIIWK